MPLDFKNLSPAECWLPFEPSAQQPCTRRLAAHLFRRAGFSANSRELDEAVKHGPQATVKKLLAGAGEAEKFDASMRTFAQTVLATNNAEVLAAWWLHRLLHTPAPLVEKTTLFWHGHFATSAAKVRQTQLLYNQNELFRKNALGKFADLVTGIARDPAMLIYLDSATNRKSHPNENFAREVMELFCLGVGQYTEKDIQELARCFTGWEIQNGQFLFNAYQHDTGAKTVLGKTGPFDGDDGLRVILEQPATANFICAKLVKFFISDQDDLPPEILAPLAQKFRAGGLAIGPVLEMIFSSRLFFSSAAIGKKIRSPVELGIGLLRGLEATANLQQMAGELRELGQMLFFPPNVKGWSGSLAWINSATLLGRANFVRQLVENGATRFGGVTLDQYLDRFGQKNSGEIVDWLDELLLAVPLPTTVRDQFIATLERGGASRLAKFKELLHLFGSLPELQLA